MNLNQFEVDEGVIMRLNVQLTASAGMIYITLWAEQSFGDKVCKQITLLSLLGFASPVALDRPVEEKTTLRKDKAVELAVEYARNHVRFRAKHLQQYYRKKGYVHYITRKGILSPVGRMRTTQITHELVSRGVVERLRARNVESLIYEGD